MTTRITPFTPEHLPALRRFGERVWPGRPRSDAFYRWRYADAPALRAFLALRDGECLALLCAFARPYRIGATTRRCLEIHDWYCLPELRSSGLGIQLLRLAMRGPEPIVSLEGTEDTVNLLPRLGFRPLTTLAKLSLPVSGRAFAGALARRARVPSALGRAAFALGAGAWLRPRRRAAPRAGRVAPAARVGPEVEALYAGETGYGTLPLWDPAHLDWLTARFPDAGHFVPLYFLVDEALRGWALLRVFEGTGGREVAIVELFAPRPDAALYTWLVSEASLAAAAFAPGWIRAQTSCPILRAALRANRFLEAGEAPVLVWAGAEAGDPPPAPVHLGFDAADGPLLPYTGSDRASGSPAPETQ